MSHESAKYEVGYETCVARCAWCWGVTSVSESHSVITSVSGPWIQLHFHHHCREQYASVSGLELRSHGTFKEWPAEKVELLRISIGMKVVDFVKVLGVHSTTYGGVMRGDLAFSTQVVKKIRHLALLNSFETSKIDWSVPGAFFAFGCILV